MPSEPSQYAGNQFLVATANRFPLMSEVLADAVPRVNAAALSHVFLEESRDELVTAASNWTSGETLLANAEAQQMGATLSFEDRMLSLQRKPNADTNSPLESWDTTIRGVVAYQGPTYTVLLPQGRETLTAGTYLERLDAIRDFSIRLGQQTTQAALMALGVQVNAWHAGARALRDAQVEAKTNLDNARTAQEALRVAAAAALIRCVGAGIYVFFENTALVDTLFDVNLLRRAPVEIAAPPADTAWDAPARLLSTTALTPGTTRLEAWREGPGGMPELLATGELNATGVLIPANITFDPGDLYQLWLQSRNSRGSSGPGPVISWTA